MKRFLRTFHRWLGLAMALQILAWMASGLYFALFPIETIRGEHLAAEPEPLEAVHLVELVPGARVAVALDREFGHDWTLDSISVVDRQRQGAWRVAGMHDGQPFTRLVDGRSGQVLPMLDADRALRAAERAVAGGGEIVAVERVDEAPAGSEYRGKPLPAWRVSFAEPEGLNLYLDAWTGEVTARRTDRWRLFDLLWMLHIMDWSTRDDFNTWWLQLAAFLGVLVVLGGLAYWAMTTSLFRRRRMAG